MEKAERAILLFGVVQIDRLKNDTEMCNIIHKRVDRRGGRAESKIWGFATYLIFGKIRPFKRRYSSAEIIIFGEGRCLGLCIKKGWGAALGEQNQ
ncbi:hypothetical protein CEXT_542741 [Caerostris extrusa]|uniref:Uncharacterized protein n=1 Tax=Caerostris extrusa TaxID=172846 RepID=A0AAV4RHG1_CAEEX|nr:hypothetical protein CEXT_542741 [Caerostris extrusa]